MTATTENYSFPYPELSDEPDGATQMQNLAVAIDTQIKSNADDVADDVTTINTALDTKRQVIGGHWRTDNSGSVSGAEAVVVSSPEVSLESNSLYLLTAYYHLATATSGEVFTAHIRETNTTGTSLEAMEITIQSSGHGVETLHAFVKTTTAVSKVYVATLVRFSGSHSAVATTPTFLAIEKLGADDVYATE